MGMDVEIGAGMALGYNEVSMKLKPIEEQVVVIVGATSGIGRATAIEMARRGARVVLGGRSRSELEHLVDEIRSTGGQATSMEMDVSNYEQVKALADYAVSAYGGIDTWVNNAGVILYSRFEDTKPEEFERLLQVNLLGQAYGDWAALPHIKQRGGSLIHISSVDSQRPIPFQGAYSASKAGINGFVEALRMELHHEGAPVNVVTIMPASINTPMFAKARTRLGVKPMPLPPIYKPDDVVKAIIHGATHQARNIMVGGAAGMFSFMQKRAPALTDHMLAPMAFNMQETDQPKSDDAPANLYEHLGGYDRSQGEWKAMTKPMSIYTWWEMNRGVRVALMLAAAVGVAAFAATLVLPRRKPTLMERVKKSRFGKGVKRTLKVATKQGKKALKRGADMGFVRAISGR